jgi:phosphatidylserine decarboxylase
MSEVSSCEFTVKEGDIVEKGQEMGMFHFGGSTFCLVLQPDVEAQFFLQGQTPGDDATNIEVNQKLVEGSGG